MSGPCLRPAPAGNDQRVDSSFYRAVFNQTATAIVVVEAGPDGRPGTALDANGAACSMFGCTREEFLALVSAHGMPDPAGHEDLLERVIAGETVRFELDLDSATGEHLRVEVMTTAAELDGRRVFISSGHDVTEHVTLEQALDAKQLRLSRSEEFAGVGSVEWDLRTDEHRWSDEFYRLLGLEPGQIPASLENYLEYVHPDDHAKVAAELDRVKTGGDHRENFARVRRSDGEWRVHRGHVGGVRDPDGELVELFVSVQDVTEEHAAQSALRASEERLAVAQQVARMGSIAWNLETGEAHWSDELYHILGMEPGEVEPDLETYLGFVHEDDRDFVTDGIRLMHRTGRGRTVDVRIRTRRGDLRVVSATSKLICNDDGRPVHQLTTVQDVTARKEMEERLRNSEAFLLKAQEIAHLGSWAVDLATGIVSWSDELYAICGITPEQWDGRVESFIGNICHPDDRQVASDVWQLMVDSLQAQEVEYRVVRPGGEVRLLLTRGEVVIGDTGEPVSVVGASWDITEIRHAEEALRLSEERFELATHGSSDGLWDWPDIDKEAFWISPRFAELLGHDAANFHPDATALGRLVHRADLDAAIAGLEAHLATDRPFDVEIRMLTKQGEYRWYRLRGKVVRDRDGRPIRLAGSLLDTHVRRESEEQLRRYQVQLRALADSVAQTAERERRRIGGELHDRTIQTLGLLRIKLGALNASVAKSSEDTPLEEILDLTDGAIDETRDLLYELSPPVLYELGFEAAVEWLAEQAQRQHGFRCRVVNDHEKRRIPERVEVVLFQCVRELLRNVGKHAEATSAEVSIETSGGAVVIRVSDDGKGVAAGRVGAPTDSGGGFGLLIIRERLDLVGGLLGVDSTSGTGSLITLSVPLEDDAAVSAGI